MKKSNLLTTAAAVMLLTAAPVWAQTCIKTPSCADLGYTKTAADCSGKTILKCPLDNTQVYCPGTEEINTPNTYNVGDYYYYNNNAVGKVIAVNGTALTVASIPSAATEVSTEGLASYCSSLNSAAAAWTPLETEDNCRKARAVWDVLQKSWNGTIITSGYAHFCQGSCSCYSSSSSTYTYYYVCQSTFKA